MSDAERQHDRALGKGSTRDTCRRLRPALLLAEPELDNIDSINELQRRRRDQSDNDAGSRAQISTTAKEMVVNMFYTQPDDTATNSPGAGALSVLVYNRCLSVELHELHAHFGMLKVWIQEKAYDCTPEPMLIRSYVPWSAGMFNVQVQVGGTKVSRVGYPFPLADFACGETQAELEMDFLVIWLLSKLAAAHLSQAREAFFGGRSCGTYYSR
ncbi:Hypothetical protein D9617_73g062130 [Elsinoe fawcettii]|nr:Hypothetical protein D9617_73g062130 [Elsinoe fawcettii]